MATPSEKIAASLEVLRAVQQDGRRVLRSHELSRVHRERLLKHGILRQIMKGWLESASPNGAADDDAPFWDFCVLYCTDRFGSEWYVSPEQSLLLWVEASAIPERVVIHTPRGTNNTVALPFGTSVYDLRESAVAVAGDVAERNGLRLLRPAAALIRVAESFFVRHPAEARRSLCSDGAEREVPARLLEGGHSAVAGRLAGAFRSVGRADIADEILATMREAGYDVRETDPFARARLSVTVEVDAAPIVGRMRALWQDMRGAVIAGFPVVPDRPGSHDVYLRLVDELFERDAYHSLAIDGYRVTRALLDRVKSGAREAGGGEENGRDRNVLAARGYWQAFRVVREAVANVLAGANAGRVARIAHREWHRELFEPFVAAQLPPHAGSLGDVADGAGGAQVLPRWKAVRDAVPAVFDLLESEAEASVRAVLGHWMFGYLHQYPDGEGRLARFLLNVMLASGGYPWTIIPVEDRTEYMAALESASAHADIQPLTSFVVERVRWSLRYQTERRVVELRS